MDLSVILNLNIPLILLVTEYNFNNDSGLIGKNLRYLQFNILNSFDRFKKFFYKFIFIGIYKVSRSCPRLYKIK